MQLLWGMLLECCSAWTPFPFVWTTNRFIYLLYSVAFRHFILKKFTFTLWFYYFHFFSFVNFTLKNNLSAWQFLLLLLNFLFMNKFVRLNVCMPHLCFRSPLMEAMMSSSSGFASIRTNQWCWLPDWSLFTFFMEQTNIYSVFSRIEVESSRQQMKSVLIWDLRVKKHFSRWVPKLILHISN